MRQNITKNVDLTRISYTNIGTINGVRIYFIDYIMQKMCDLKSMEFEIPLHEMYSVMPISNNGSKNFSKRELIQILESVKNGVIYETNEKIFNIIEIRGINLYINLGFNYNPNKSSNSIIILKEIYEESDRFTMQLFLDAIGRKNISLNISEFKKRYDIKNKENARVNKRIINSIKKCEEMTNKNFKYEIIYEGSYNLISWIKIDFRRAVMEKKSHEVNNVYRHIDKDGKILYIGKTSNISCRTSQHKKNSPWFKDIDKIDRMIFKESGLMDLYEMYFISKYKSVYNKEYSNFDYHLYIKDIEENFEEYKFKI